MKTLVIGATGRVAGALTRRLVSDGISVRAPVMDGSLVDLGHAERRQAPKRLVLRILDTRSQ